MNRLPANRSRRASRSLRRTVSISSSARGSSGATTRLSLDDPAAPPENPSISSILDDAALGKDIFQPATVFLLEKRSFELAHAQEDPRKISTLFSLVPKSRDTAVRERLLEVQKQKLALRREEQAFNHGHGESDLAALPPG